MINFFLGIIEITLGMSLLIPLMLLVLRVIGGKFTAKCRYILWTLVLIRLALPFSFGILPALIEVPVEPVTEVRTEVQTTVTVPTPEYIPPQISPGTIIQPQPSAQPSVPTPVPETPEPTEQLTEAAWERLLHLLSAAYLAVAALFLCWNLLSYTVYTRKILRTGREPEEHTKAVYTTVCRSKNLCYTPRLLLSPYVNSPAAFGMIRRCIVLPDIEFSDNALTGTLMHEVTHCRRGDLYIKAAALFARSLHWFNPLVHLTAFRCEMEMELSCDEEVLAGCSDETRAAYGEMMLDIICRCRQNRGTLTTHFNPKKTAVKVRLKNILYGSGKLRGRWLIAVCLILCLAAGTIVACRVEAEKTEQTEAIEDNTEETPETQESGSFWTYELSDTLSLSYNTNESGAYILSASDENGEPYPLTEVSLDILQFGSNETLREILPLSHRTTEDGYLFYFRYHIQFAYFYEITLIHKEDRLEYGSIRKIEQEEAEKLGVYSAEMVTVTSLEELADYRDNYIISESVYDFYYDLLSGESEIPEYNTVRIEDYSIRFTVPMTEYSTYFSFTVSESGLDTLPEGTYDWQVYDIREVSVDYSHYDNTEYLDIPEVQKLFAYFSGLFAYNTPTYGADLMPYHAIRQYICTYYGKNQAIPRVDFCRIAEEEFGITDFSVFDLATWSDHNDLIYAGGVGGGWSGEILDVFEKDNKVTVTMQFYADCNELLKSYKIAYYFGDNGTWQGYDILEDSPRKPHRMHYEDEISNVVYTIAINQLRGRMKQMNNEGSLPSRDYKVHVTGMSVPVTLTMSLDHVTAVEAHGHKIQMRDPFDVYGNCKFDLFEADGAIIIEGGDNDIGDIYVLTPDGFSETPPGKEASYYLISDAYGNLTYKLTNNSIAGIQQNGALSSAVAYDEFLYAVGSAAIEDSQIVFSPPAESYTMSDVYDLDEEFRLKYSDHYDSIEDVFERNRQYRSEAAESRNEITVTEYKTNSQLMPTVSCMDREMAVPAYWYEEQIGMIDAAETNLNPEMKFAFQLNEWRSYEEFQTGCVWTLSAVLLTDFAETAARFMETEGVDVYTSGYGNSRYLIGTDAEYAYVLILPTDVQYLENDSVSRENYEFLQEESQAVLELFMSINEITPNPDCPPSAVYAPVVTISHTSPVYRCDDVYILDSTPTHGESTITFPNGLGEFELYACKVMLCDDSCDPDSVVWRAFWGYAGGWPLELIAEYEPSDIWSYPTRVYRCTVPEENLENMRGTAEQVEAYGHRRIYLYLMTLSENLYAYISVQPKEEINTAPMPENEQELADLLVSEVQINYTYSPAPAADPADLYQTFLDTVAAPYTDYLTATEYIDLDGNGINELILYNWGASANNGIEIYTIENGAVRSFSTGVSGITVYSGTAIPLAAPSVHANDFVYYGQPSSMDTKGIQLSFRSCADSETETPCTILYSYNGHETSKFAAYYCFFSDPNGYLDVLSLGTYTIEAVNSNPALGWDCYVNGQPVTKQQYMDSMRELWDTMSVKYSVSYTEENTIADFDLLLETPGSASEYLRDVLHTFNTHLPMVYLSRNGSNTFHVWDSAYVTQCLNTLTSAYTFEPLTAMEVQEGTPITLTPTDGTWTIEVWENSDYLSLITGGETYFYRASPTITTPSEPVGTHLCIAHLCRAFEETLLTGEDHISAFLADGYTVKEENGMLLLSHRNPELADTILSNPDWVRQDIRCLGLEQTGAEQYRIFYQMDVSNTANDNFTVLSYSMELMQESGVLKLVGIDLG